MDSEITLVNPAPPKPYFLSSTDLTDAVIFTEPAVPLYRVTSDDKHIRIYDSTTANRLIAVLHRRDILSDTISFPSRCRNSSDSASTNRRRIFEKQVSIQRWFKRSKMRDGTTAFTIDTDYGPYVWKATSRHRLKVFADHDLDHPVASCYLHRTFPPRHPALVLQSAGEPLRDDIIVAYLIQRYRVMVEKNTLDLLVGARPVPVSRR